MFMTVPIICAHQRHVNAQMMLKATTYVRKRWLALQVTVPPEWIDALFPGVRKLLEIVLARNARIQSGRRQAEDLLSGKAA